MKSAFPLCSGQRDHPHVGLEDGLQLPAHPRRRAAGLPGQRVGDLRLHVRPLGEPADHRGGRQDHQGVPGGRHGGKRPHEGAAILESAFIIIIFFYYFLFCNL